MSTKIDVRAVKVQFLTEVANYILHQYAREPLLTSERLELDASTPQYVWYKFIRNRDYMLLERQSPNPETALNDIITENFPMLKSAFGSTSRAGNHPIGVSEDSYHSYFLLLPPNDEINAESEGGSVDKFVKKLVKRAHSFLKAFANPDSLPPTADSGAVPSVSTASLPPPPPPVTSAAAPPPPLTVPTAAAAAAAATSVVQPTQAPVVANVEPVLSKRERNAMEQAAQNAKDEEAFLELRAVKRARDADDLKRKADAELARKREDEERAALAEQAERERIVAELERLEQERQERAAHCPFPKRPAGAVGFVREPFQTADGLIVNPWFLLH